MANSKQRYENFADTFQGDKHKSGQKAFGAQGDVDKTKMKDNKSLTNLEPEKKKKLSKSLTFEDIDFDAVEQLRLKLKIACTTHKGSEPSRIFDKWDSDKDGELDHDEVLEGMNKMLGKDVLEEWNMFANFFAYIDTDGDGKIDRDEFAEFVMHQPDVKIIKRKSQQFNDKQRYENFADTFQGDKHKGGQKSFGIATGDAWQYDEFM